VAVLALGVPVTAGLAWAFDLTWRGVERTAPAEGTGKRAGTRPAVALVVVGALLGAAVAGFAGWHLWGRSAAPGPDGRVLVAVADVVNETGEKELDVLSGLLVTSLEQSRRLSVMTQARVLDLAIRAGRKGAARVDETVGREVGKANGVRALLLPAIRRLGNTYSLEMRAIDPVSDRHLFTVSDRSVSKEALLELLDRLSERTRTELGEGAKELGTSRVQLGEAMTRSLEAYQHYVAGLEARFRYGLRAAALREFLAALDLDPGFAAAQGQLAGVFHAYGRADLSLERWRAAAAGIERMPLKERTILQLQRSFDTDMLVRWSKEDALRLAGEIEARFGDDKAALVFAAGAYDAFDQSENAERLLRRALDLDPGYFAAAWVLSDRLGAEEAHQIARRAVSTSRSPVNRWLLAEASRRGGDDAQAAATARELLREDGATNSLITQLACDTLYQVGSDVECLPLWKRMAVDGQNEYERDFAQYKLMDALAFRGRIRDAMQVQGPGWDPSRVSSPYLPGRFSTRPGMLVAIQQVGFPRLEAPKAVEHARRIIHPQYRRNWLAFLGAEEEAETINRSLEKRGFRVVDEVYRYYDLVRDGRLVEAADLARTTGDEVHRKSVATSLFGVALLEAEALLASGRTAEAAAVWPAPLPCRCTDPLDFAMNYPRLALLRARAMEQLGRRPDAIRELDGVLVFWKNADPDLPLLIEAKAMRKRLEKQAPAPGARP
jgi:tetratricopeptide (TPR) repeat protein